MLIHHILQMPLILPEMILCEVKKANLSTNYVVQYTIVAALILGAVGWLLWSMRRKNRGKRGSCAGCALSATCPGTHPRHNSAPQCPSDRKQK